MEGKKFNSVTKVTTVNSNQSLLLTDQNGNVTSIGMDALKADLSLGSHTWCGRVWNTANAPPRRPWWSATSMSSVSCRSP